MARTSTPWRLLPGGELGRGLPLTAAVTAANVAD